MPLHFPLKVSVVSCERNKIHWITTSAGYPGRIFKRQLKKDYHGTVFHVLSKLAEKKVGRSAHHK